MIATEQADAVWAPPGPGEWVYDPSHSPPAPTLLMRRIGAESGTTAYRKVFERFGGPLDTIDIRYINGKMFRRLVPLVGGDKDRAVPPAPVLWLASRLHPLFRKRDRLARKTMEERTFLEPVDDWDGGERQGWIDANLALQDQDVTPMTDGALAAHVRELAAHTLTGWTRHHELHGTDLGPIGDLLAHTNRWGLDPVAVMGTLKGSSPATTEAAEALHAIATVLTDAGVDVDSLADLDDVRSADDEAAMLLDGYLRLFGWRVVTSYDIEALTTGELPQAILAGIKSAAADGPTGDADTGQADRLLDELAEQLDAEHREAFRGMAMDARRAYGLRDDNGPLTAEWPIGLIRRAYLEVGDRLLRSGRFGRADDAFELDSDELADVLDGAAQPDGTEIVRRREHRSWEAGLDVPALLGPAMEPPDPAILPAGLRRMTEAVVAAVSLLEPDEAPRQPLTGLGIGEKAHVGRARVAHAAEDVLATMEPGDVLVAAWTAPTFNTVLGLAGGVVVQEGGLLCHAAVMARELGIPAVIGVDDVMSLVTDGDLVEVDPSSGRVTILEPADG